MKKPPHLFISPHRDDACFSLAATIRLLGGGHLINVFSQSQYIAHPSLIKNRPPLDAAAVTDIRNKEDSHFAGLMNLERYELGFEDTSIRKVDWNFEANQDIGEEAILLADQIQPMLRSLLEDLIPQSNIQEYSLFIPMAIGGHRDHLATLMACLGIQNSDWGDQFRWLFYEDLPYASWKHERTKGLRRFEKITNCQSLRKSCLKLGLDEVSKKMEMVQIYASQHANTPLLEHYMPRDSWLHGPHEALWQA